MQKQKDDQCCLKFIAIQIIYVQSSVKIFIYTKDVYLRKEEFQLKIIIITSEISSILYTVQYLIQLHKC